MSTTKQASEMTAEELLGVATARPWIHTPTYLKYLSIHADSGNPHHTRGRICQIDNLEDRADNGLAPVQGRAVTEANAELIVRAVGAFGEMREALKETHDDLLIFQQEDERHLTVERVAERLEQLRKALALADGKKP